MNTRPGRLGRLILLLPVLLCCLAACDSSGSDWAKAKLADSAAGYREFLSLHPSSNHAEAAKQRIEELEYQAASRANTVEAYEQFLRSNPSATYARNANQRIDSLSWAAAEKANTIGEYEQFMRNRPASTFVPEAAKRIEGLSWASAEAARTIEAYSRFIEAHPSSARVQEARTRIEQLSRIQQWFFSNTPQVLAYVGSTVRVLDSSDYEIRLRRQQDGWHVVHGEPERMKRGTVIYVGHARAGMALPERGTALKGALVYNTVIEGGRLRNIPTAGEGGIDIAVDG